MMLYGQFLYSYYYANQFWKINNYFQQTKCINECSIHWRV